MPLKYFNDQHCPVSPQNMSQRSGQLVLGHGSKGGELLSNKQLKIKKMQRKTSNLLILNAVPPEILTLDLIQ